MSGQSQFELILASLHKAMLDDAEWSRTSALIEEACEASGSVLALGEGPAEDVRIHMAGLYHRGERREDLERDYVEIYAPTDEAVARFRQQPYGRLTSPVDVYTKAELKTSPTFNEFLRRARSQKGLLVRLGGPEGYSHVSWGVCNPVGSDGGWSARQIEMIKRVVPHVRQFVLVRVALADAGVLGRSLSELAESRRLGVVLLGRNGKVMAANRWACGVLRRDAGLCDRGGVLRATHPADRARFDQLLSNALPQTASPPVGGSMGLGASSDRRHRLVVHIKPTLPGVTSLAGSRTAAVVLIVDPWRPPRIGVDHVAAVLGLTRAESKVACWLAEGKTVGEIAASTGRQKRTIYWLLEQIYAKLGVRRQVDLVRLVLAAADFD